MPDPKRVRPRSPGDAGPYVVRRDTPIRKGDTVPLYITAPGHEILQGAVTPLLPYARRWTDRPTVWRWLKRRQRPELDAARLDAAWYVHNLGARQSANGVATSHPH